MTEDQTVNCTLALQQLSLLDYLFSINRTERFFTWQQHHIIIVHTYHTMMTKTNDINHNTHTTQATEPTSVFLSHVTQCQDWHQTQCETFLSRTPTITILSYTYHTHQLYSKQRLSFLCPLVTSFVQQVRPSSVHLSVVMCVYLSITTVLYLPASSTWSHWHSEGHDQ